MERPRRETSYEDAVEQASRPLRPIQAALRDEGVQMEIVQTGGWCMVGYAFLSDQGFGGPHIGVTKEDGDGYLVCAYRNDDGDTGIPLHGEYVRMGQAVDIVKRFFPERHQVWYPDGGLGL
jgi:hypothetical protein